MIKKLNLKKLVPFYILIIQSTFLQAQKFTISGYISDKATGERLINANVYDANSLSGTTANTYGFYSITLPAGDIDLVASFIGYSEQEVRIKLTQNVSIDFELEVRSDELGEVTVYGNNSRKQIESSQMSVTELTPQKLKTIPVVLGEADVLKVMQLLPGVQSGVEGTSGIYVRGGGADQNLFLLDGVPVYNAGHVLGIFSVFNPAAIKTVKLFKGGFPALYGGRLSSVVDVTMNDGNMKKIKGDFSIGLISSKLMLEGPIVKDKTSFMLSARRSYIDVVAWPIFKIYSSTLGNEDITAGAFFHDYNLKLNHIFSDRSRLYISGYFGKDKLFQKVTNDNTGGSDDYYDTSGNVYSSSVTGYNEYGMGIEWGNTIASARWNYLLSNKLFSNTTVTYSNYVFDILQESYSEHSSKENDFDRELFSYYSGIRDISAKIDFDYFPAPGHDIKFGLNYTNHYFTPGAFKNISEGGYNDTTIVYETNVYTNEVQAYIEDDITISGKLKANIGFHLSLFNVEGKNYLTPQPRLSLRYKVNENWSLKASYSRMAQHLHLLSTSGLNLPTDIWVPVTKRIEPPVSDQIAIGTAINLPANLSLTFEGFYKNMKNLLEYRDGASFSPMTGNWEDKVTSGRGWVYGGEIMLEKNVGKTTGWIGYTLSWNNRQFDEINYGRVFPATYDRRHDISIVLTHKFSDKFDIGATWVYGTGNAVTMAYTNYQLANIPGTESTRVIDNYKSSNNYRLPASHRLDLGVNFHKKKKRGVATWSISLYNVYNQLNPFYISWDTYSYKKETTVDGVVVEEKGNVTKLNKFSVLPIIPSVSYSFKF